MPVHPIRRDTKPRPGLSHAGREQDLPHAEAWLGERIRSDGVHELYALSSRDVAGSLAFALLLGRRKQRQDARPLLWVREKKGGGCHCVPYGPGLAELGIDPATVRLLCLPDGKAVLRASLDATRDGAASSMLIELCGRQKLLTLTATRRLALAAAETGTMVLLVRSNAEPSPSAAHTRWQVTCAPSHPLEAGAPGLPAFALTLLRHRGGRDGLNLIVEWDRDTASFRERAANADIAAAPVSRPASTVDACRAGNERGPRAA